MTALMKLRGLLGVLSVALAVAGPRAQAEPAEYALSHTLEQVMNEMRHDHRCVARKDRHSMAFLGLSDNSAHLKPGERNLLNRMMRSALEGTGLLFSYANAENMAAMVGLSQTLQMDADELNQRLAQMKAEFTLLAHVARPEPDVVELRISLYGRQGEGAPESGCDRTISQMVNLKTQEVAPMPSVEGDYLTFRGAIEAGLMRSREILQSAERLGWTLRTHFSAGCGLERWARDEAQGAYFDVRDRASRAQLGSSEADRWPGLFEDPGEDAPTLEMTLGPSVHGPPGISMTFKIVQAGQTLDQMRMDVVVTRGLLRRCRETVYAPSGTTQPVEVVEVIPAPDPVPDPDPVPPAVLKISTERPTLDIGEDIRFSVEAPVPCRLSIVNVDTKGRSCVVLPLPGLPDAVLSPGEPYVFPPMGRIHGAEAGTETFIAICNADAAALAQTQAGRTTVDCVEGNASRERAVLDGLGLTAPDARPVEDSAVTERAASPFLQAELKIEIRAPALPIGMSAVPGSYGAPAGKCYLRLAQTATAQEALNVASRWTTETDGARIFQAQDGRYNVVGSVLAQSQADWILNRLRQKSQIPVDSDCTDGRLFTAEIR